MKQLLFATATLAMLSACAALPPSAESLAEAPLVRFGDAPPENKDYVLHFPAGQPIPVKLSIIGNAFNQPRNETTEVSLVRDVYVHKNWLSYDRQTWIEANKALDFNIDIRIPGYAHPRDGIIKVMMDFKK